MTTPTTASALPTSSAISEWRAYNVTWLRSALRLLRLQLSRHALSIGAATGTYRRLDWLVAADDAELLRSTPTADEIALGRSLEKQTDGDDEAQHDSALSSLAMQAELTTFERNLLLLAAAPSLDGGFARAYAELHDDPRRDHATLQLALSLYGHDTADRLLSADCLMPSRALRRLHLLSIDDDEDVPLLLRRLSVDERMSDYVRGVNRLDSRLMRYLVAMHPTLANDSSARAAGDAAALVRTAENQWSTVNLLGTSEGGARDAARQACVSLGLRPQLLDVRRLAVCLPIERAEIIALLGREALLAGFAAIVDTDDVERGSAQAQVVDELVETLSATLFLISAERWPSVRNVGVVRVARPTRVEQRVMWRDALSMHVHTVNGEVDAIAQQFDLGADAIEETVARAALRGGEITGRMLWAACREQTGTSLDDLARRITPSYEWDDIVVSDDVRSQLRELASQVEHRARVYEAWGFGAQLGRGRGISALFAGASGTGKTMAAEILAAHLELDLYRVDLAGVVSKFVGETEKNLRRVFDAAERSGAILFFDEADALFGSRTEVRDSHDRYANLEINYLLQRMEDYAGLAILATNRRSALDAAFLRRLRFVIDFPFPGADERRRIWERVFPAKAVVEALELSLLSNLELSGGNIRSIAVNAAFLAASDDCAIGMGHVVRAAAREYVKLSKPIGAQEFGAYSALVRR